MVLLNSCIGPLAKAAKVCPKKKHKTNDTLVLAMLVDLNIFDSIALFTVVATVV